MNCQVIGFYLSAADLLAIGDINRDGKVTKADIQSLLDLIASTGGGTVNAVPEPARFILMLVGACLLRPSRRAKLTSRVLL